MTVTINWCRYGRTSRPATVPNCNW